MAESMNEKDSNEFSGEESKSTVRQELGNTPAGLEAASIGLNLEKVSVVENVLSEPATDDQSANKSSDNCTSELAHNDDPSNPASIMTDTLLLDVKTVSKDVEKSGDGISDSILDVVALDDGRAKESGESAISDLIPEANGKGNGDGLGNYSKVDEPEVSRMRGASSNDETTLNRDDPKLDDERVEVKGSEEPERRTESEVDLSTSDVVSIGEVTATVSNLDLSASGSELVDATPSVSICESEGQTSHDDSDDYNSDSLTEGHDSSDDTEGSDIEGSDTARSGESGEREGEDLGEDEFYSGGEEAGGEEGEGAEPRIGEKRLSGDGEEQPEIDGADKSGSAAGGVPAAEPGARVDDDEDRQNPAYIPRKGAFFEHDLRGANDEDAGGEEKKDDKSNNKRLWREDTKWHHDKYDERSMAPKSYDEIIATYGYDIRAHGPGEPIRGGGGGGGRPRGGRGQGRRLGDYLSQDKSRPSAPRDRHRDDSQSGGEEIGGYPGNRRAVPNLEQGGRRSDGYVDRRRADRTNDVSLVESNRRDDSGDSEMVRDRRRLDANRENAIARKPDGYSQSRHSSSRAGGGQEPSAESGRAREEAERRAESDRRIEPDKRAKPRDPVGRPEDFLALGASPRGDGAMPRGVGEHERADAGPTRGEDILQITTRSRTDAERHSVARGNQDGGRAVDGGRDMRGGAGGGVRGLDGARRGNESRARFGSGRMGYDNASGRAPNLDGREGEAYEERGGGWSGEQRHGGHGRYDDGTAPRFARHRPDYEQGGGSGRLRTREGGPDEGDRLENNRGGGGSHPQPHLTRTIQNSSIGGGPRYNRRIEDDGGRSGPPGGGRRGGEDRERGYTEEAVIVTTAGGGRGSQDARYDQRGEASYDTRVTGGGQRGGDGRGADIRVRAETQARQGQLPEKRSTIIVHGATGAPPEILPPVTHIGAYPRPTAPRPITSTAGGGGTSSPSARVEPRPSDVPQSASARPTEGARGWAGGEFTPAWQQQPPAGAGGDKLDTAPAKASKRYSTQTRSSQRVGDLDQEGPGGEGCAGGEQQGGTGGEERAVQQVRPTVGVAQRQFGAGGGQGPPIAYFEQGRLPAGAFPPPPILSHMPTSLGVYRLPGGPQGSHQGPPPPHMTSPPQGGQGPPPHMMAGGQQVMQQGGGAQGLPPGAHIRLYNHPPPPPGLLPMMGGGVQYVGGGYIAAQPQHHQVIYDPSGRYQMATLQQVVRGSPMPPDGMELHSAPPIYYTAAPPPSDPRSPRDLHGGAGAMYYGSPVPTGTPGGDGMGGGGGAAQGRGRSPPRRAKVAIPIVNPHDIASSQGYDQQHQQLYGTYTTEYEEIPTYVYVDASRVHHHQQQSDDGLANNGGGGTPAAAEYQPA